MQDGYRMEGTGIGQRVPVYMGDGCRTEGMGTGLRGSLWDRGVRCGMEWTIVG